MAKKPPSLQKRIDGILAHRRRFPQINDAAFADCISVFEACEIMGVTTSYVYRLIRSGQLAGKALTRTTYVVSRKAAQANASEYRRTKNRGRGRPRSGAA